jgi:tetratricopeptide (TPR) repeat protein
MRFQLIPFKKVLLFKAIVCLQKTQDPPPLPWDDLPAEWRAVKPVEHHFIAESIGGRVGFCLLAVACLAFPCGAQKGGGASGGSGGGGNRGGSTGGGFPGAVNPNINVYNTPSSVNVPPPITNIPTQPKPMLNEDEKCLPWLVSEGKDTAVSVTRLQIPSKARGEYEKACDSNNKGKFDDAEKHVRGAIDKIEKYSAAWVLLGVVLEEEKKDPDARDACEHAMTIDAKYSAAYLCRAEFSTRDQDWQQVANVANMALGLNSAGDGYAYYYLATAQFHTDHLSEAKKTALQASEFDANHENVPLYFLLAQIYDAEGNKPEAVAQLRQILKHHVDHEQELAAKQYLADLQSRPAASTATSTK